MSGRGGLSCFVLDMRAPASRSPDCARCRAGITSTKSSSPRSSSQTQDSSVTGVAGGRCCATMLASERAAIGGGTRGGRPSSSWRWPNVSAGPTMRSFGQLVAGAYARERVLDLLQAARRWRMLGVRPGDRSRNSCTRSTRDAPRRRPASSRRSRDDERASGGGSVGGEAAVRSRPAARWRHRRDPAQCLRGAGARPTSVSALDDRRRRHWSCVMTSTSCPIVWRRPNGECGLGLRPAVRGRR